MAQERTIRARVDAQVTGDTAGVRKLADDVDRVGTEARQAAGAAGGFAQNVNRAGKAARGASGDVDRLGGRVDRLEKENRELKAALAASDRELKKFIRTGKNVDRLNKSFQTLKTVIAGLAIAKATQALKGSVTLIADFAEQMSKVRAVSGATDEQIAALTARARELGKTTKFTGQEAAEGMEELARRGFRAEEVLAAAGSALRLAASSAVELSQAAEVAAGSLKAFNLPAAEMERVVDVIAATSASSGANVLGFGETAKEAGSLAADSKIRFETFAAAIGVLGDNMRTGTAAGTDIKAILASLANPSDAAEDALYRMGLTVDDVNIKQRGLIPVLETLKAGVERLQEQGLEGGEVWEIFGRKGANALKILTGQLDRVKELENELDSATGTTKRLADVMADNLGGALKALNSAVEELGLSFGDGLTPALRGATDDLTELSRESGEGAKALGQIAGTIVIIVEAVGQGLSAAFSLAATSVAGFTDLAARAVASILEHFASLADFAGLDGFAESFRRSAEDLRFVANEVLEQQGKETGEHLRRVREDLGQLVDRLNETWSGVAKGPKDATKALEEAGKGLEPAAKKVAESLVRLAEAAKAGSDDVRTSGLSDAVREQLENVREAVRSLGNSDPETVSRLRSQMEEIVRAVGDRNPELAAEVAKLKATLSEPISGGGLGASASAIKKELQVILGDFREAEITLRNRAPALREALQNLLGQDLSLTTEQQNKITKSVDELVNALRTRIQSLGGSKGLELLSDADIASIRAQFGEVVEIVRLAGGKLDQDLAALGRNLGFDVSGLRASKDEVDRVLDEILGDVRGARELLRKEAPALAEAISEIGLGNFFGLKDDQRERLKESVQEIVDAARAVGEKIEPEIADAANYLGIIVGAWERASDAATGYGAAASGAAGAAVELTRNKDGVLEMATASEKAAEGMRSIGQAASGAAGGAVELTRNKDGILEMRSASDAAAEGIRSIGTAADSSASSVSNAAGKTSEASEAFGTAAQNVAAGTKALGEQTDEAGAATEGLEGVGGAAEFVADSQKNAAESAREQTSAMRELLTTARELGEVKVRLDFSDTKRDIEEVGRLLSGLKQAVDDVRQAAEAA